MSADLLVKARVSVDGDWLDLMADPYRLSGEALVESSTSWRRNDVSSPFVHGSWTVAAVMENVQENIDVYVRAGDSESLQQAVLTLCRPFSQPNYLLEIQFDTAKVVYQCYVADFSVKASRELRFARMAQVTFTVPRDPIATWSIVTEA